ncbi:MAG: hypothetical protein B6243_07810 [Anaerolineaceae bacterium 4572_5.2]|nr:MAG: hypothetical protein B6243_07810 [Anaerolineaceae bacterium 4572_5.2]
MTGGSPEFIQIQIGLTPKNLEGYDSLLAYVQNNHSDLPPENIISIENRPDTSQGYSVVQAIVIGLGESNIYYLTNGNNVVYVRTTYGEEEKIYLSGCIPIV